MKCEHVRNLFEDLAAGAVSYDNDRDVELHLDDCQACAKDLVTKVPAIVDAELYFRAPGGLRERILRDIKPRELVRSAAPEGSRRMWFSVPLAFAAGIALCALVTVFLFEGTTRGDVVARDIVSSHVRSLMADHLTDVPSSDKHTVKPWFDGKLDFAPPVPDLDAQGFTLVGGRLDYVSGRPAAALVYKRRQHYINVFVFQGEAPTGSGDLQGYNFAHWNKNGMSYWVVSDLNADELQQLALLFQN